MNISELTEKAITIQKAYKALNKQKGQHEWHAAEYAQGLVSDLGELMELLMAKNNYRDGSDIDSKLKHEIADCLWSVLLIAHELDIDLEKAFLHSMDELQERIAKLSAQ